MKKVTIIVGPPSSGKTSLVKQLAEGRKAVFVSPNIGNSPFLFSNVKADTEVIVMEETNSVHLIRGLACSSQIMINRQGRKPIEIDTPELIFTSNFLSKKDFEHANRLDFTIIELTKTHQSND